MINNMKFLTTAIAFLAFFGTNAIDPCRTRPREDFIQSGSVQFVNSYNFKQTCYTVNIDFSIPKQGLKTAISTVTHDGFNTKNGLDYSVRARKKQNANALSLSLLSSDRAWRKITVSYLATSRDDLNIGSFIADTFSMLGCETTSSSSNSAVIQQQLSFNFQAGQKYSIAAYISGIRSQKDKLNIQLSQERIDNKGVLSMRLNSNSNSIQNLHISYVIWRQGSFEFRTFKPTDNLDADYKIMGVRSFSNSKQLAEGLAILSDRISCNGFGCPSSCCKKPDCLSRGGQFYNNICIICNKTEKYWEGKCMPSCGFKYVFDRGQCVCEKGLVEWNKQCVEPCAYGQQRTSYGKCDCKNGFVRLNGACRQCPQNSKFINGACVCNSDCKWDDNKYLCVKIPPYVPPYIPPYVPQPPLSQISCPARSTWNQSKLGCQCSYTDQYMISNKCQKCPQLQAWNGKQCVCRSGLYRIAGTCRSCDINSTYDGKNCVCNWGFYGNADRCDKCHITCGRCKGPGADKCETCTDVSFQLKNGYCSRNTCPPGFYASTQTSTCQLCSSYCDECVSESACRSCVTGFKLEQMYLENQKVSVCTQICGDGRRFEDECDDGNIQDGDGCSCNCKVEQGYTCSGGSTVKKSTCAKFIPDRCIINPTKQVQLVGRVVQGIRLTYIPKQLTQNQCANCYKILQVKVISSSVVPGVKLSFIPKSQYQFMCEFDFNGLWAIPVFTITIQIHPDFSKYFSAEDMAQVSTVRIDPATLILTSVDDTLSIDDIDNESAPPSYAGQIADQIF